MKHRAVAAVVPVLTHWQPAGPADIQELITLSHDGNTYTGKFTITTYVYDGKSVTDANSDMGPPTLLTGTVAATRIKP